MKKILEFSQEQTKTLESNLPLLIYGSAGSGKTKILIQKIINWIAKEKVEPSSILAIFNSIFISNEIKKTIIQHTDKNIQNINIGSFELIFAKILKEECEKVDLPPNFTIYDVDDSLSLVSSICERMNYFNEKNTAEKVQRKIANLKSYGLNSKNYCKKKNLDAAEKKFAEIFAEYEQRLEFNRAIDLQDISIKTLDLFKKNENVLKKYRKLFSYIAVDDLQLYNSIQLEIITLLGTKREFIATADKFQNVNSYYGSSNELLKEFEKNFPKLKFLFLRENYRSTKNIALGSASLINYNKKKPDLEIISNKTEGEKITYIRCADEKEEAFFVTKHIKKEITEKKINFNDIAVIYRLKPQVRSLQDGFERQKLPFRIIGANSFFCEKEVKNLICYLKVIANPRDEQSLLRIMNYPQRGIGNTSIEKMLEFSRKLNISLYETMSRIFEVIEVKERIQKNVKAFRLLLEKYINLKNKVSVPELLSSLLDEIKLVQLYKEENTEEAKENIEKIEKFMERISWIFKENSTWNIEDFLTYASVVKPIDDFIPEENQTTLIHIQNVKGLEFKTVFISGLEEDIFPMSNRFDPYSNIDEEKKLFYLCLNRAKEKVFVTYTRSRYRFGEVAYHDRSLFLDEIDQQYIDELYGVKSRKSLKKSSDKKEEIDPEYLEYFNSEPKSIRVGSRVEHQKFGIGKVLQIEGEDDNQKITVNFEQFGQKILLAKFANLKVL